MYTSLLSWGASVWFKAWSIPTKRQQWAGGSRGWSTGCLHVKHGRWTNQGTLTWRWNPQCLDVWWSETHGGLMEVIVHIKLGIYWYIWRCWFYSLEFLKWMVQTPTRTWEDSGMGWLGLLEFRVFFHFHDYGRNSGSPILRSLLTWN